MSDLIEKKGAERAPAFEDSMRAAEEAAGIPDDAELYGEAWAQPTPDETGRVPSPSPPRDEEGTPVVAEDTAEAPEAETTPEQGSEPVEEPPAAPFDPQILQELADLKAKVGTLVNENAELRKGQYQAPVDTSWFQQLVEENPAQAAYYAAEQQNPLLYDQAIRGWYDIDPVAATRYENQMAMAQMQQQFQQQIAPRLEGAESVAQRAELDQAITNVKAKHDDFDAIMGPLDETRTQRIIDSGFPARILEGLSGSQQDKETALETLYRWVKAEQSGSFQAAAEQAKVEASEEAKERKRKATVASATTTTPEPVEETEEQRLMRTWGEQRPSMRKGWENRPK